MADFHVGKGVYLWRADLILGKVVRALPVGTVVQVYEEKGGWVRINPTQSEWVSGQFLSKIS